MKKVFKLTALCMLFILGAYLLPPQIAIAEVDRDIQPMYIDIDYFTNSFDINSGGLASVYSAVYAGKADNTSVLVYLQQYSNGNWSTVTSWYGSGLGAHSYANGTYTVPHGLYRIQSYCYVYIGGSLTDYDSYTSYVVTY